MYGLPTSNQHGVAVLGSLAYSALPEIKLQLKAEWKNYVQNLVERNKKDELFCLSNCTFFARIPCVKFSFFCHLFQPYHCTNFSSISPYVCSSSLLPVIYWPYMRLLPTLMVYNYFILKAILQVRIDKVFNVPLK